VSNPLNDEIAKLLLDLQKLEEDLERHLRIMEQIGLLGNVSDQDRRKYSVQFQMRDDFEKKIDYGRQKLISLELMMLDNSVKDLRSTTTQVDSSVKSLQETTKDVLKSSTKLERLTLILVMVTILVALTGIFSVSVVYMTINPLIGAIGVDATVVGFVAFIAYFIPIIRELRKS
jgi:hypothetical protein